MLKYSQMAFKTLSENIFHTQILFFFHGVTKSWTRLSDWTELNWTKLLRKCENRNHQKYKDKKCPSHSLSLEDSDSCMAAQRMREQDTEGAAPGQRAPNTDDPRCAEGNPRSTTYTELMSRTHSGRRIQEWERAGQDIVLFYHTFSHNGVTFTLYIFYTMQLFNWYVLFSLKK